MQKRVYNAGCNGDIRIIHGVVRFEHSLLFKSKNICLEVLETMLKINITKADRARANSITIMIEARSINLIVGIRFV